MQDFIPKVIIYLDLLGFVLILIIFVLLLCERLQQILFLYLFIWRLLPRFSSKDHNLDFTTDIFSPDYYQRDYCLRDYHLSPQKAYLDHHRRPSHHQGLHQVDLSLVLVLPIFAVNLREHNHHEP